MFKKVLLLGQSVIFALALFAGMPAQAIDTPEDVLDVTYVEVMSTTNTSATIFWLSNTGSQGEYRLSRGSDLTNVSWTSSGVISGIESGRLYGNKVTVSGLTAGTTYYMEVRGWVADPNVRGGKVYGASETIRFATNNEDSLSLDVDFVEVNSTTDTSVTIFWKSVTAGQGEYRVSKGSDLTNVSWSNRAVISGINSGRANGNKVTLTGLIPNTTYYMEVRVWQESSGNKVYGATKTISFTTNKDGLPDVTDVEISSVTMDSATLSWRFDASGVGEYRLTPSREKLSYASWETDGVSASASYSSQFALAGLTPGTTYYVEVRARQVSGRLYGATKTISFTTAVVTKPSIDLIVRDIWYSNDTSTDQSGGIFGVVYCNQGASPVSSMEVSITLRGSTVKSFVPNAGECWLSPEFFRGQAVTFTNDPFTKLTAVIDSTSVIAETNELNNSLTDEVFVNIKALEITEYKVSNIDSYGASIYFTSKYGNRGRLRYSNNRDGLNSSDWHQHGRYEDDTPNEIDISGLKPDTTYYVELQDAYSYGLQVNGPSKFISFKTTANKEDGLAVVEVKANDVTKTSATIDWLFDKGAVGEYRYTTSRDGLASKSWTGSGVINGTGLSSLYASRVALSGLKVDATYYVEVRGWIGEGDFGKVYSPSKIISFTTNNSTGGGGGGGGGIVISNTNLNVSSDISGQILGDGQLIKSSDHPAVYMIDQGQRRLFSNEKTFWSWYNGSWSAIKRDGSTRAIKAQSVNDLPVGLNVTVRPGSRLIKFDNSERVYIVFRGNRLYPIDESSAIAKFKADWRSRVITIQSAFEVDYLSGEGSLFTDSDNDGIDDRDESAYYGTDPSKRDTDSDGYSDGNEVISGYNPKGAGAL